MNRLFSGGIGLKFK